MSSGVTGEQGRLTSALLGVTVKPGRSSRPCGLGTGNAGRGVDPKPVMQPAGSGAPGRTPWGQCRGPRSFRCPGSGGGARPSGLPSLPLPDPCHNGGSCTDGINTAFCDCLPGFQGAFCEEDINECASNPCRNGANCTDCVDSYTCTCPAGFSGIHCENNTPDCTERCVGATATGMGAVQGGPGPWAGVGRQMGRRATQCLATCTPSRCLPGGHTVPVGLTQVLFL